MSRTTRDLICDLAKDFEAENNAAFSLWSWLPSYKIAEKYHGDYASSFQPSIASILEEAAFVLAEKAGYEQSAEDRAEYLQCPCGEGCEENGKSLTAADEVVESSS